MIVKGKRTEVQYTDVEINIVEVLNKLWTDSFPSKAAYFREGVWYQEIGFDYHKREEHYGPMREANEEEMELYDAFQKVIEYVKESE
jgi:hypothetical protein